MIHPFIQLWLLRWMTHVRGANGHLGHLINGHLCLQTVPVDEVPQVLEPLQSERGSNALSHYVWGRSPLSGVYLLCRYNELNPRGFK